MISTRTRINAKEALIVVLNRELTDLSGRFLSDEEQLRVLSLGDEIDRLEDEIEELQRA